MTPWDCAGWLQGCAPFSSYEKGHSINLRSNPRALHSKIKHFKSSEYLIPKDIKITTKRPAAFLTHPPPTGVRGARTGRPPEAVTKATDKYVEEGQETLPASGAQAHPWSLRPVVKPF